MRMETSCGGGRLWTVQRMVGQRGTQRRASRWDPVKHQLPQLVTVHHLSPVAVGRKRTQAFWVSCVLLSTGAVQVEDDHQEQKQKQVGVKPVGLIQPSLWCSDPEHGARHVHSLMRSTAGWVYRSDSDDGGRSWTTARRTRIPNNNSGGPLPFQLSSPLFPPLSHRRPGEQCTTPLRSRSIATQHGSQLECFHTERMLGRD
jgi:predicted neuraminidase